MFLGKHSTFVIYINRCTANPRKKIDHSTGNNKINEAHGNYNKV